MQRLKSAAMRIRKAAWQGANCRDDGLAAWFLWQHVRGSKINGSEVKVGQIVDRKGRLMTVIKTQHAQSGRGGATIQVEFRDLESGLKSSDRLRTTEAIEKVDIDTVSYTVLYESGNNVTLMEPKTFEQFELSKELFGNAGAYVTDGMEVSLGMHDGKPISGTIPTQVVCTVAKAEPAIKGQTSAPSYKRVVLENGRLIMAPQFIESGDEIIINTLDETYMSRAK